MFVRVYDKDNDRFYKSIVYGKLNQGYYQQAILLNPFTCSFELVDYIDKSEQKLTPKYAVINSDQNGWVTYEKTYLLKFKKYCKDHGFKDNVESFSGYDEVFQNFDFMFRLLNEKSVAKEQVNIQIRKPEDINIWTYISTEEDANDFLKDFVGFHDSIIEKIVYEEDYGQRRLTVTFDNSGWYGIVELCFEGLIAMNLIPAQENFSREIYGGTLVVKDESIFWADDVLQNEEMNFEVSYIKALNLKWRKID
ncbi:MAG: uncharacterized protein K0R71_1514 [Bacillales bacterium]|nr:uncharacterized protein [Bacillales bacterium]